MTDYRYTLSRITTTPTLRPLKRVLWVMLNPSTADDKTDDPTIRKCIGFAERWCCTFMSVVNLYAARSTNPRGLREIRNPIGPENDRTILHEATHANLIVLAWGNLPTHALRRMRSVLWLLEPWRLKTLGMTKKGHPRHPSRAPYSTQLLDFGGDTREGPESKE